MDIEIRVRADEGADQQKLLVWDTAWDPNSSVGDWKLVDGGLQSSHMLNTAILISLMTHRRVEKYELTKYDGNDVKGWWGDTVDVEPGESEIGSKLWLLYRSVLNDDIGRKAVAYAHEALQPLVKQGAVASFDITYEIDVTRGMLGLVIKGYGNDGARVFDQRFTRIWGQEFS